MKTYKKLKEGGNFKSLMIHKVCGRGRRVLKSYPSRFEELRTVARTGANRSENQTLTVCE